MSGSNGNDNFDEINENSVEYKVISQYGKNNNIHSYHLENHHNTRSKHKVEFRKLLIENGLA